MKPVVSLQPKRGVSTSSSSSKEWRIWPGALLTHLLAGIAFWNLHAESTDLEDLITYQQLKDLAAALDLELPEKETPEALHLLKNKCFEAAYQLCTNGHWEKIKPMAGILSSLTDDWGRTLLSHAVEWQDQEIVEKLVELEIGLNKKDEEGNTPLHIAAYEGNAGILSFLCNSNHFNSKDRNLCGETALHVAIKADQVECVKVLKEKKADLKASLGVDSISLDPLALCISSNAKKCFDELFTLDGIQSKTKEEGNLLHWAIWSGNHEMLLHLLENYKAQTKALIEKGDAKGRSPLSLAAYLGDEAAIKILYEKGASLETRDQKMNSPLHWCVIGNKQEAFDYLFHLGCQDVANKNGKTALGLAETRNQDMATFIRKISTGKPRNPKEQPPENLVIKGGGPKGIALVGALEELEKNEAFVNLKKMAGASAGAILASLLSVGYTSSGIKDILKSIDLTNVLDYPEELKTEGWTDYLAGFKQEMESIQQKGVSKTKLTKEVFKTYWKWWWLPNSTKEVLRESYQSGGFCTGNFIRELIDQKLEEQVEQLTGKKIKYLTFGELRKLVKEHGSPFRHLYIVATKLGPKPEVKIFSSEDPKCDSIIISDAVRASLSIPAVFQPHIIHRKVNGERFADVDLGFLVDGGVLMNFPIKIFDTKEHKKDRVPEENKKDPWINPLTWGLSLYSPEENSEKDEKDFTILDVLCELIKIYLSAEDLLRPEEETKSRTIEVNNCGVSLLEFKLSKEQELQLQESGRIGARQFLAGTKLALIGKSKLHYNSLELTRKIHAGIFNLKTPHPSFMQRDRILQNLEDLLQVNNLQSNTLKRLILSGPGGVGKSEMAIAYAYRHLENYSLIWWIDEATAETQSRGYRELAKALKIKFERRGNEEISLQEVKKKVYSCLESQKFDKPWLLILDNIEKMPKELPSQGGAVLITSRPENIDSVEDILSIEGFDEKEAIKLLKEITGEAGSPKMRELAKELAYSPLLLTCAAHYIFSTPGLSISKYLDLYKDKKQTLKQALLSEKDPYERHLSLAATYLLTLDDLRRQNSLIVDCLQSCAHLNPSNIPVDFLDALLKEKKINSRERRRHYEDILKLFRNYELIRYSSGTFSLHKLWQEVIQNTKNNASFQEALAALNDYFPVTRYNSTHKETISPFQAMLPHCVSLLSSSSDLLSQNPLASTRLALTVVRYFLETAGNLSEAENYLKIANRQAPYVHEAFQGRIYFYWGMLRRKQARQTQDKESKKQLYQQALEDFKKVQQHYEKDKVPEHYEHLEQNKEKCHSLYQQAIAGDYQAQTLMNLGEIEKSQDLLKEAYNLFENVQTKLKEFTNGKEHFDMTRVLRDQGVILWRLGQKKEAQQKVSEAIEMQKRVYGTRFDHQPTAAATYSILGDIYWDDENSKAACDAWLRALEINRNIYQTENLYIKELEKKISMCEKS